MQSAVAGIGNGHLPVQRAFEVLGGVFQKEAKDDATDNGKKKIQEDFCLFVSELAVSSF